MRDWCIPPALLCRRHLLGWHVEAHKAAGHARLDRNWGRYLEGRLSPARIGQWHAEAAAELSERGYQHNSPLGSLPAGLPGRTLDPTGNLKELARRCPECRARIGSNAAARSMRSAFRRAGEEE